MGLGVAAQLARQLGVGVVGSTSDHAAVVSINLFIALLCACIVLGHLLEENRWVNESITALIIVSTPLHYIHAACFVVATPGECRPAAPVLTMPFGLCDGRGCAPAW
jgi:hypothetical protein